MTTIRLLHISDPHICRFLNVRQLSRRLSLGTVAKTLATNYTFAPKYSPKRLGCFLNFAQKRSSTLDGIILTGDIATTGRDFDLTTRLSLLPGNHDRWVPYRKGKGSAIISTNDGHVYLEAFSVPDEIGRAHV